MALTHTVQNHIDSLTNAILNHYRVHEPPVPIEKILTNPPEGIDSVDIRDMSLVFGVGEHRFEYRLALGRLLYRELCRADYRGPEHAPDEVPLPSNSNAARHFAASLLMPRAMLQNAIGDPEATLHDLSLIYQVPDYAMASRLAQLGYYVKGMQ